MTLEQDGPGALAGAHRVDVIMLAGKSDVEGNNATSHDLQVRKVLDRYLVSVPLAMVIAEIAFSSGRAA